MSHTAANRLVLVVATLNCLAGCTSQPLVANYEPQQTECCSKVHDFPFRQMVPGQDIQFQLTSADPTYSSNGKRQHFAAFRTPACLRPTAIHVTTYLSTEFFPKATAVSPDLIFLDADFAVLGQSEVSDWQPSDNQWRSAAMGRAVVPSATRYVVVIPGEGLRGRPFSLPAAALGELSLRIYGEKIAGLTPCTTQP